MIRNTHRAEHGWENPGTLSSAVVEAIAEATGQDAADVDPLYEALDPDALDGLFQPVTAGPERDLGRVVFTHEGVEVTVHAHGGIVVDGATDRRH